MKLPNEPDSPVPPLPTKTANTDLKMILGALTALVIVFHVGSAWRGHGQFRDIHLGTALHYAQTKVSLVDTVIVGFNATGTPTIQELPVWQMAAGLAFKVLGPWWGWANVVSLALFLPCLVPLFHVARQFLDERRAWWALIFFLAEPLVFLNAGTASTDGFSLAITIWFLACGVELLQTPDGKWLLLAAVCGSLAAVSKLPFFMAAGLALFFLALGSPGFNFKRLIFLTAAGGMAGIVFLAWTHYTDAQQAGALFPLVDLRLTKGTNMLFWYFGDLHYRLSAGNWIKGGWRSLTALLGSFALLGLVLLALTRKNGSRAARSLLAGAVVTTLIFTHLVLHHWHYYLMFAPAVALLCAEGLGVLEMKWAPDGVRGTFSFFVAGLIGLSLLQGLMGMHSLTYDPYPAKMAELIRQHTTPADKLVVVGGGWGGELLFRSDRAGLSTWDALVFDRPENLARLKSLGYDKLVLVSESPFHNAIQVVNPGQTETAREMAGTWLTPLTKTWPVDYESGDLSIREIP